MFLFTGPYALAAIVDAIETVRMPLIRRIMTRPSPAYFALSLRRIKQSTSAIVSHESTELVHEAMEDAPMHTLDHAYEYFLTFIIMYYAFLFIHRLHQDKIRSG